MNHAELSRPSDEEDAQEDDNTLSGVPEEVEKAYQEAKLYLTRAKKQRAEVEKARGYFRAGASQEGKNFVLKSLKGKLPCSKCGGLGWIPRQAFT